jgi:hypothetical protein
VVKKGLQFFVVGEESAEAGQFRLEQVTPGVTIDSKHFLRFGERYCLLARIPELPRTRSQYARALASPALFFD